MITSLTFLLPFASYLMQMASFFSWTQAFSFLEASSKLNPFLILQIQIELTLLMMISVDLLKQVLWYCYQVSLWFKFSNRLSFCFVNHRLCVFRNDCSHDSPKEFSWRNECWIIVREVINELRMCRYDFSIQSTHIKRFVSWNRLDIDSCILHMLDDQDLLSSCNRGVLS